MGFERGFLSLCPLRGRGGSCACLPSLTNQMMEHLAARLDGALLNAMVRRAGGEEEEAVPTPPSDLITDPRAMLFPPGPLTFARGIQIKIVVRGSAAPGMLEAPG